MGRGRRSTENHLSHFVFPRLLGTGGLPVPREPHAWFRQQTGWRMTTINRQKIKLVKDRDKKAEATKKLRELLTLRDHNPAPESGELTVAAVIDLYLPHARGKLSERSCYERKLYLG